MWDRMIRNVPIRITGRSCYYGQARLKFWYRPSVCGFDGVGGGTERWDGPRDGERERRRGDRAGGCTDGDWADGCTSSRRGIRRRRDRGNGAVRSVGFFSCYRYVFSRIQFFFAIRILLFRSCADVRWITTSWSIAFVGGSRRKTSVSPKSSH